MKATQFFVTASSRFITARVGVVSLLALVRLLEMRDGRAVFEVGSGTYEFGSQN